MRAGFIGRPWLSTRTTIWFCRSPRLDSASEEPLSTAGFPSYAQAASTSRSARSTAIRNPGSALTADTAADRGTQAQAQLNPRDLAICHPARKSTLPWPTARCARHRDGGSACSRTTKHPRIFYELGVRMISFTHGPDAARRRAVKTTRVVDCHEQALLSYARWTDWASSSTCRISALPVSSMSSSSRLVL